MRILVAEDEKSLNNVIVRRLREEGHNVDSVFDGGEAYDYISASRYDIALFDVSMPVADGFSVLEKIRREGNTTPVIFLTARDSVEDRVKGLDLGSCDYIVKPFSFAELNARIRAAVRKSDGNQTGKYTVNTLTVDTVRHEVTRAGRMIELSAKEYSLLEYMIRNKGVVLSREKI